jgi:hypothetical protein
MKITKIIDLQTILHFPYRSDIRADVLKPCYFLAKLDTLATTLQSLYSRKLDFLR